MRVARPSTNAAGTIRDCRLFAGSLSSVTSARRFVAEALAHVPRPLLEAVELMVSELASNCVTHARAEFEVCIVRSAGALRVEVTDSGGGVPIMKHPDVNDLRGRGLVIVKELADEWGVVPRAGRTGKMVWFAVRGT
jgi:anti-sigma regulatory factor (Ser/Thr protein kinase)